MKLRTLVLYLILTTAAVTFVYPFLWMASASLKPQAEASSLALYSPNFALDNYRAVFLRIPICRAFFNSLLVATCSTALVIIFSSLVGYALARLEFRLRGAVLTAVMVTMMIPGQLTLIPLYRLIVAFGWMDSYWALILPQSIAAMGILIFRQSFRAVPEELLEAARLEGAGEFHILRKIFLPLAIPAAVTTGIIAFMASWNEVLWPLIVVRDQKMMTMPQLVVLFSKGGQAGGQMGIEMAAAMFLVVPVVLAYSFFQRYFVESMASAGLKG